jgi:hypothetical protein
MQSFARSSGCLQQHDLVCPSSPTKRAGLMRRATSVPRARITLYECVGSMGVECSWLVPATEGTMRFDLL